MATGNPKFINRELSWLEFNQRVLDEAQDGSVPLLDRLHFLSITASNLDEFFMVRVGGLELLAAAGVTKTEPSGMTALEQLDCIRVRTQAMVADQYRCFMEELDPALAEQGIRRIRPEALTGAQGKHLERVFEQEIFPVVTPAAVDTAGAFPLLPNLRLNLAVRLRTAQDDPKPRFAVIPIGSGMSRFVTVPVDTGYGYVLVEDVVKLFADRFFVGEPVVEIVPFRMTRNADMSAREDFASDFLAEMREVLRRRKESGCVRLEVDARVSRTLLKFLQRRTGVKPENTYEVQGPLGLAAFSSLAFMDGFESLRYPRWPPQPSPEVDTRKGIFEELSQKSLLLLHPYESFDPVVRFVQEAARDPDVLAIKQILYRTSDNSPIVGALRAAAERGKTVTVLVELRARFDEARNIEWAAELERAGVQVIYGVKGFKVHAKVCIVVRREAAGIVRYVHFGTGNYNEKTATLYTDVSYMTRDAELGADASALFNAICGYSEMRAFTKLEAAPNSLRTKILELIESETERCVQGQKAVIMGKMNSLVDSDVIKALYRASRAGVEILLNVRGICCLRPGRKGQSENIKVLSIVDRYLEHSRVFYFRHGGEGLVLMSSADLMPRNLDRRVELLVPVDDPTHRRRLVGVLEAAFKDNAKGRWLRADGTYAAPDMVGTRGAFRSQDVLYRQACDAVRAAQRKQHTTFKPHRPPGLEGSEQ